MKFIKEDFEDDMYDPSLDFDGNNDFDADLDFAGEDTLDGGMAEIEMTLAEPSKLVDADGSVVLVGAGDTLTIRSESLKRVKSF